MHCQIFLCVTCSFVARVCITNIEIINTDVGKLYYMVIFMNDRGSNVGAFDSFAVYSDEGGCLVKGKCFRSQGKHESPHVMKVSMWQAIQIIYIVTVIFVHICKGYSCHKQVHWHQKGGSVQNLCRCVESMHWLISLCY